MTFANGRRKLLTLPLLSIPSQSQLWTVLALTIPCTVLREVVLSVPNPSHQAAV
jgi:hypothetical protein